VGEGSKWKGMVMWSEYDQSTLYSCMRIMKPMKNCKKEKGGIRHYKKENRRHEFDQSTFMHVWKNHNETPLYN
jgi:hypothetical protein